MTKIARALDLNGWVLYDGACPICCSWAARFEKTLTRRGFDLAPLQSPWVSECFDFVLPDHPSEMLVLAADGRVFGGMDAILFIARSTWWAWPLYAIGLVPLLRRALHTAYRLIAAHRMCFRGEC